MNNLGFGYSKLGNTSSALGLDGTVGVKFGRVVDVILDSFHPNFKEYGESQALNGVLYRELSSPVKEDEESPLKFAYCNPASIKKVPLRGEIVRLATLPTENRSKSPIATKTYWTEIVSIWNHPHHNAYPDTIQNNESDNDFGKYFVEEDKVAPIQSFPGDLIIEGRHGQSIRFTGTKYESNIFIENSNNGKPLTIISNGQKEPSDGFTPVVEDINEDPSSIFLTSDHTIPLKQSNLKRDAWKEEPEQADKFKGSQAIINAGRLYFNAKEEHVLISSAQGIGLNGKTISLDGEDYIGLDANKIYLGTIALDKEDEPVLLGQSTTDLIEDFLNLFNTVVKTLATLPPAPPAAIAKLIAVGNQIVPQVPTIKSRLPLLHSKKVFTE